MAGEPNRNPPQLKAIREKPLMTRVFGLQTFPGPTTNSAGLPIEWGGFIVTGIQVALDFFPPNEQAPTPNDACRHLLLASKIN
jgi:hypothetical protein